MTLIIKRLTDYTVKHLSGLSNIPHLCVKVRHQNGFAWFGVNVVGITDTSPWSRQLEETILKLFVDAMQKIIDLEALESEIPLLLRSLQDITTGRKRPVMFGGDSNEFIQICSDNNVQIEAYRNEVKQESTTYGGYFMTVSVRDKTYPVMVYHRGIILYNYIERETVLELVRNELCGKFPEVFPYNESTFDFSTIMQLPRNRSKRA
jgi:hypothetical protein